MKIRLRESQTDLKEELLLLFPKIIKVAQKEYDQWDESDIDTYANGGICHLIADEILNIVATLDNVNISTYTYSHIQHQVVVVGRAINMEDEEDSNYTDKECFIIDIPYYCYETGGGFSWKKIPDVEFDETMIQLHEVDYDDYFDEDGNSYD